MDFYTLHSSLLWCGINYGRKKFYDTGPRLNNQTTTKAATADTTWTECYKTFYGSNLRVFEKGQSVCPWQAFPALSNGFGQGQSQP
jgi:hypothetical protein